MIALWLAGLLSGCGQPEVDPLSASLSGWPDDPVALLKVCEQQAFDELAITCRVQAAARFGERGDGVGAEAACALIPEGTWREECHFRAGEELGRAGETTEGLRHCAAAGWFARNCLTHAGWHLPPDPALTSTVDPAALAAAADELLGAVDQALASATDGVPGEGRDIVGSRFGYNVYVGTGVADPGPAHLDGPLGVVMRTGFGIEAARLLPDPSVEAILAVFRGERPPPTGAPLPERERVGRYTTPIPAPAEASAPRVPIYGGGLRLVGDGVEEDATIAALEGLFWRESTDGAIYLPYLDDPRPRVRWTAAKLLRLTPSKTIDTEATLRQLAASHPDEGVRWHAADGLEHRTWEPGRRRR